MIRFLDVDYFPYILLASDGSHVFGLDPRPLASIEREWQDKVRVAAQRLATAVRGHVRAEIMNQKLASKDDAIPQGDVQQIPLDEVTPVPADFPGEEEIVRLVGLPHDAARSEWAGYGAVSMLAGDIKGIARAWGEPAHDFCTGVPMRVVRKFTARKRTYRSKVKTGGRKK